MPHSQVGTIEGRILFYGSLVALIISIGVGYTFDLFGRRNLIALSYLTLVVLIWTLPMMPTIGWLIIHRIIASVAYQYLHSHPLIIDYIKSESRGRATSLQALGSGLGEFIAMTVLLTIQLNFPASIGVWIVGAVVGLMAVAVVLMIREPVIKKH